MDFISLFNNFWSTTGITLIKLFVLIVFGMLIIRVIMRFVKKGFMASQMEAGLSTFLLSVIRAILYVLLIYLVLSTLGVSMGAFIAALSAAGLAVALALQDSLSNLASGILILVNKPFVEGDYIKVGNDEGVVKAVRIFTTQIESYDKKIITIPNKVVISSNVVNYTSSPTRRVTIPFCVPYNVDQNLVKQVVCEEFRACKYAIKSPEMFIGVENYNEHGLLFVLKIWGTSEDYWNLYYLSYEKLTRALNNAGITITNDNSVIKISENDKNFSRNDSQIKNFESYAKSISERAELNMAQESTSGFSSANSLPHHVKVATFAKDTDAKHSSPCDPTPLKSATQAPLNNSKFKLDAQDTLATAQFEDGDIGATQDEQVLYSEGKEIDAGEREICKTDGVVVDTDKNNFSTPTTQSEATEELELNRPSRPKKKHKFLWWRKNEED